MTSHLVQGRPMPNAIAGHPALEFCNTKALWGLPTEHEYFTDFTAVVIWAREHSVITPSEARQLRGESAARQRAMLGQVRALRKALYYAVIDVAPADEVLGFVSRAVARSRYVRDSEILRLNVPSAPTAIVDRIALEAHQLLEQHGPGAVGLCASEACGWVFLDPTHRRRWCVMAVCGNRAKARRFAQRQRAGCA